MFGFFNVYLIGFFAVFSLSVRSEKIAPVDFEIILKNFDAAIAMLEDKEISSVQLESLSKKIRLIEASIAEKKPSCENPINVHDGVKSYGVAGAKGLFFVSPGEHRVEHGTFEPVPFPQFDSPSPKSSSSNASSSSSSESSDLPSASSSSSSKELGADKKNRIPHNTIYAHSRFGFDYLENYIPKEQRINASIELQKLEKDSPDEVLFRLMLVVETNFRRIINANPNLIGVVNYIGQAVNQQKRGSEHASDIRDPLKVLGCKKARTLAGILDANHNVRMNTLVYHIPKQHLDVFEALLADIFQIMQLGYSAKIATKKAHETLLVYKAWKPRIATLKEHKLWNHAEEISRKRLRAAH